MIMQTTREKKHKQNDKNKMEVLRNGKWERGGNCVQSEIWINYVGTGMLCPCQTLTHTENNRKAGKIPLVFNRSSAE